MDTLLGERKTGTLPFSPPIDRWTEDHYSLFGLVELSLGNRKEVTPEERREMEVAEMAEGLAESGDPNWLQKVQQLISEDGFENLVIDDALMAEIEQDPSIR